MNKRDVKKQELLEDLAKRFRSSANNLREIAHRINQAAQEHHDTVKRISAAGENLRKETGSQTGPLPFSYLEFLEFADNDEFKKFKDMPVITDDEIKAVDWDDLLGKL